MTKRNNNIINSCNEIKNLLLWHGEMLRNIDINYQIRLENDLYFKEKVFKILHSIKRTTWRGEKEKCTEQDNNIYFSTEDGLKKMASFDSSKNFDASDYPRFKITPICKNQTTTANIDVSTIPYY